ncbi:MAG: hypothetical protein HYV63_18385 [Candidatus Schekmanbacteria bacterium]|nr:hypothetical protein [Candidatus Schekmanbacteria bacterium]
MNTDAIPEGDEVQLRIGNMLRKLEGTAVDVGRQMASLRREVAHLRRVNAVQKMELDTLRSRERLLSEKLELAVRDLEELNGPPAEEPQK